KGASLFSLYNTITRYLTQKQRERKDKKGSHREKEERKEKRGEKGAGGKGEKKRKRRKKKGEKGKERGSGRERQREEFGVFISRTRLLELKKRQERERLRQRHLATGWRHQRRSCASAAFLHFCRHW
ncbi:hypothetical protein CFOL_v3_12918, partial [Cephalotus follicularis]